MKWINQTNCPDNPASRKDAGFLGKKPLIMDLKGLFLKGLAVAFIGSALISLTGIIYRLWW